MQGLKERVCAFARDVRGTTAIEYGLIVALIAIALLVGLRTLGSTNSSGWNNTADKLGTAMDGG
jgi:pilus assembly protein Flp/PilA